MSQSDVDDLEMSLSLDTTIIMSWADARFVHFNYSDNYAGCTHGILRVDQLHSIWMPDLYIFNSMMEVRLQTLNRMLGS